MRAVGALNPDLTKADFSNHGDWVHCSAVGVGVVSTFVKGLHAAGARPRQPGRRLPRDAVGDLDGYVVHRAADQRSGRPPLCGDPGLAPRAAFDQLLSNRPKLPNSQTVVVNLLPGTP